VLTRSSKTPEEAHEHHVCECARLYRRYWTCRDALPRISHVSFLDPSGGAADSFTCAIAYNDNNAAVLDCLVEIKAPFNPDSATIDLAATLKSYGLNKTTAHHYAAQWVVAAFARHGITLTHSERDRITIYLDTTLRLPRRWRSNSADGAGFSKGGSKSPSTVLPMMQWPNYDVPRRCRGTNGKFGSRRRCGCRPAAMPSCCREVCAPRNALVSHDEDLNGATTLS